MTKPFVLSEFGRRSTTPSPVNQMMASFASDFRDDLDVNLGVGYINEATIPASRMTDAIASILRSPQKYRLPFNYGGPEGTKNLRNAIGRYLVNVRQDMDATVLGRHRVGIGASGAASLLDAIGQILPRGIVITSDPMYYIYCETLSRLGFEILTVPEDDDGIRVDLLEAAIENLGPRVGDVRFVYVVTVNNPTCTVLSAERRFGLLKTVRNLSNDLNRAVPLILDRAYEDLIHTPAAAQDSDMTTSLTAKSLLSEDHDGLVFELGTLSKLLAPSLRIGYVVGEDGPFMRALVQRTSDVGFSAPVLMQALAAYMLEHHIEAQLQRVNTEYRQKSERTAEMIKDYLGAHLEHVTGGQAGFYFYLTFRKILTGPQSAFFKYCTRTADDNAINGDPLNRRVIYVPGEYCVHAEGALVEKGSRQLRISYGFESLEQIEAGLKVMAEAASYCH